MRILVLADEQMKNELKEKFKDAHEYICYKNYEFDKRIFRQVDLAFDFILAEHPDQVHLYEREDKLPIFLNTIKTSLAQLLCHSIKLQNTNASNFIGFNGLPGFFNRELLEITSLSNITHNNQIELFTKLGTKYIQVQDRVGMVTPRVVCMIINEAFYTLQEGTASEEDIDQGMKLGTNYPYGPFEWASKIGLKNVYQLLESVYQDTKDERYKICPLLKHRALVS